MPNHQNDDVEAMRLRLTEFARFQIELGRQTIARAERVLMILELPDRFPNPETEATRLFDSGLEMPLSPTD